MTLVRFLEDLGHVLYRFLNQEVACLIFDDQVRVEDELAAGVVVQVGLQCLLRFLTIFAAVPLLLLHIIRLLEPILPLLVRQYILHLVLLESICARLQITGVRDAVAEVVIRSVFVVFARYRLTVEVLVESRRVTNVYLVVVLIVGEDVVAWIYGAFFEVSRLDQIEYAVYAR